MPVDAGRPEEAEVGNVRVYRWHHKLTSVLFAIFCFEMGIFLLVFPWVEAWGRNYFSFFAPASSRGAALAELWRGIWMSPYFRGAISGLGLLNMYISLVEVGRLKRFSAARRDE
jgi:hypothetical protein